MQSQQPNAPTTAAAELYQELNSLCIGLTGTCTQIVDTVLADGDQKQILTLLSAWSNRALALHSYISGFQAGCLAEKKQLLQKAAAINTIVFKAIPTLREILATKPPTRTATCQTIKTELATAIKAVGAAATVLAKAMASQPHPGSLRNSNPSTAFQQPTTNLSSTEQAIKCLDILYEISCNQDSDQLLSLVSQLVSQANQLIISFPNGTSPQLKQNSASILAITRMVVNNPTENSLANFTTLKEKIQDSIAGYLPAGVSHPIFQKIEPIPDNSQQQQPEETITTNQKQADPSSSDEEEPKVVVVPVADAKTEEEEEFVKLIRQVAKNFFGSEWEKLSKEALWKFDQTLQAEIVQYKTQLDKKPPVSIPYHNQNTATPPSPPPIARTNFRKESSSNFLQRPTTSSEKPKAKGLAKFTSTKDINSAIKIHF